MDGGSSTPAGRLPLIDIIYAGSVLIVQTIWATMADLGAGHRLTLTLTETITDEVRLMHRLSELVPAMMARAA
jgi:hypothetical protein